MSSIFEDENLDINKNTFRVHLKVVQTLRNTFGTEIVTTRHDIPPCHPWKDYHYIY